MRCCLACESTFDGAPTDCPHCGGRPSEIDGFLAFAPELASGHHDFPGDAHDVLDRTQDNSFWFRERNALIVWLLRRYFPNARSLLEVGCGTGFVLSAIESSCPGMRLAGSEVAIDALKHARRRLPHVHLMQMDARAIPFAQEFDVIAAFDVLEHISDDERVLAEFGRAVRPGGGLLLSVPQHPWLWSKADELACHKRRYARHELARKVRDAGWRVVCQTSFVSMLLPALALQRLISGQRSGYRAENELNLPPVLDKVLGAVLHTERRCIEFGVRFPIGGSRFLVAQKK